MSLVRFNHQNLNPRFSNFFVDDNFRKGFYEYTPNGVPAVNISENENSFEIFLAAPGLKKEDFKISIDKKILTVSSEIENNSEENVADKKFTRKEYSFSKFSRSFNLPESVDLEKIEAKYENGELKLFVPKLEKAKLEVREIYVL